MSLLRASDLLQLQFQVSHPAIMHRTKMLVKRRGVFAVQCTKMNFDQILSIDKLVTLLKFIYSEKATKFCEISTVDLSYVVPVRSTVEISQNFVAFSEYMNFIIQKLT